MKKLSYILSGLLIAGASAIFSSCGDNTDFWGLHTLTDDEIRQGSKGDSVKWLQFQLNANGAGLDIDGIFGPKTEEAVINYKKAKGLLGIADISTINSLK